MFSEEIRSLLVEVIASWQVLAVTVVLIFYIFLVNYVARIHHRSRRLSMPKIKKSASSKAPAPSAPETVSDDDELGLEE
jgi:hypothetical protein